MKKQNFKMLVESIVEEVLQDNADPHKVLPNIVRDFVKHAKGKMGFNQGVTVILRKDPENAKQILGNTGYYDPNNNQVVLYVTNRHPKDILRSLSHELVHHTQNCNNRFEPLDPEVSQKVKDNDRIKGLEAEAYETGNLVFREWEEHLKEADSQMLDEFNAMGTGAVVGFMGPLGMDMAPVHAAMHSGDVPLKKTKRRKKIKKEEYLGKKGGVRYFQMGGGIKNDAMYNKTTSGKPTRRPGVPGLKKKKSP